MKTRTAVTHTPTCYLDKDAPGVIRFTDGDKFCGVLAGIRAPMIVRAVNAHEGMIDLLHEAANLIASVKSAGANYPLVKRIHKAISDAEGK